MTTKNDIPVIEPTEKKKTSKRKIEAARIAREAKARKKAERTKGRKTNQVSVTNPELPDQLPDTRVKKNTPKKKKPVGTTSTQVKIDEEDVKNTVDVEPNNPPVDVGKIRNDPADVVERTSSVSDPPKELIIPGLEALTDVITRLSTKMDNFRIPVNNESVIEEKKLHTSKMSGVRNPRKISLRAPQMKLRF